MLLGKYCLNRMKIERTAAKEGWRYVIRPWTVRNLSGTIVPEGNESGPGGSLDIFGCEVIYTGGIEILESLWKLDVATLAAFIEWNRINLLRTQQRFFIRRFVIFLVALLGVIASLDKVHVLDYPIVKDIFTLYAHVLLKQWWSTILFVVVVVVFEVAVWRPRRSRIEEFGQMLAVAFAYVSRRPSPEKPKKETFLTNEVE